MDGRWPATFSGQPSAARQPHAPKLGASFAQPPTPSSPSPSPLLQDWPIVFYPFSKSESTTESTKKHPTDPATDDTMPPSLLHPPSQLSPSAALQLSQQAPNVLSESLSAVSSSPFSLFSAAETPELWIKYENLLLSCLRTGDERAAHECLERLTTRFGKTNERVMALSGLVKEADAQNPDDLEKVLKEYDEVLSEDSANIVRCPRGPEPMHPSR